MCDLRSVSRNHFEGARTAAKILSTNEKKADDQQSERHEEPRSYLWLGWAHPGQCRIVRCRCSLLTSLDFCFGSRERPKSSRRVSRFEFNWLVCSRSLRPRLAPYRCHPVGDFALGPLRALLVCGKTGDHRDRDRDSDDAQPTVTPSVGVAVAGPNFY